MSFNKQHIAKCRCAE